MVWRVPITLTISTKMIFPLLALVEQQEEEWVCQWVACLKASDQAVEEVVEEVEVCTT
jgi:hypothetical protein